MLIFIVCIQNHHSWDMLQNNQGEGFAGADVITLLQAHSNEADDWETVAEGMTTPSAAKAAAFKATSEGAASTVSPGKK